MAIGSVGLNHSTKAPATARRTMKKGAPSRRSSLASVSFPSTRKAPPVRWARPIHPLLMRPGSLGGGALRTGNFFVGVVREREDVPRARGFDLELVAMPQRYPSPLSAQG